MMTIMRRRSRVMTLMNHFIRTDNFTPNDPFYSSAPIFSTTNFTSEIHVPRRSILPQRSILSLTTHFNTITHFTPINHFSLTTHIYPMTHVTLRPQILENIWKGKQSKSLQRILLIPFPDDSNPLWIGWRGCRALLAPTPSSSHIYHAPKGTNQTMVRPGAHLVWSVSD